MNLMTRTLAEAQAARTFPTITTLKLFVPGRPAPQGSKRHVGRGILIESSKEVGPWRERVALAAHEMMRESKTPMLDRGIAISASIAFTMPRPTSAPKRVLPAVKRPDIDKLGRAILDALTDVVFPDDSAVVELVMRKEIARIGEQPGASITLTFDTPAA